MRMGLAGSGAFTLSLKPSTAPGMPSLPCCCSCSGCCSSRVANVPASASGAACKVSEGACFDALMAVGSVNVVVLCLEFSESDRGCTLLLKTSETCSQQCLWLNSGLSCTLSHAASPHSTTKQGMFTFCTNMGSPVFQLCAAMWSTDNDKEGWAYWIRATLKDIPSPQCPAGQGSCVTMFQGHLS